MFKKTIAVLTIAVFLSSSVSFALEDFYSLRARAAAERDQGSVRVPTSDPAAAGVMNRLGTSELPGVFIGSHPDDIEEATTGLQLNLLGSGRNNIYWGVIADGETGVWDNQVEGYQSLPPAEIKKRKVAMREAESKKAAQVMGLPDGRVKFFRFGTGDERPQPPDNKAHKFSETIGPREREFIDHLKDISKRYPAGTPIAVAWNTDEDNHTCHAYCAKFVKAAVDKFVQETGRPVCIVRFKQLQGVAAAERPNAYVLIDQAASDKKDDVLRCHDSQEQRQASQGRTTMVAECRKQESEIKLKGAQTAFPAEKLDEYVRAERFQISELKPVFSKGICRILVVDNSEDDAKITARAIKRWRPDAVVEMATDLNEALDKYMSAARGGEPFEAVVSDVDISASGSARTGFELVDELQKMHAETLKIAPASVVLMTGGYAGHKPQIDRYINAGLVAGAAAKGTTGSMAQVIAALARADYKEAVADRTNKSDSDRRMATLREEIADRIITRSGKIASGDEAVKEAEWLLSSLIVHSNCSDFLFKRNMPPHMQEMEGIVMMLDPKAPPELIIAAMLHDSDRFFDGYYVMMKDEPPMGSPAYNDFYKPIQHPRMAAEFIVPLLRRLKIDENIVVRVEALIKNHETGITFERRDTAQPLSENDWQDLEHDCNVLRDTDSILVFTPVLLTTILVDLRQRGKSEEFEHEVRIKYGRANPRTRAIIDKLMLGREAEYRATPDGASAYETFLKVRREFAPAAEAAVPASAIVPFKEACYDVAELNRALREALGAAERGEQIGGLAGGIIADIKNTYEDQSPDFVQMQIRRRFEITHRFEQHFGANGGIALARAPGRVNLIGEHIDNQDAKVMPMPIDKDVIIAFRPTDDGSVILHNMRTEYYRGTTPGPSLRPFNANEVPYTTIIEFGATVTKATPDVPRGETFAYIMGSALGIKKLVGGKKVKGCSMLIDGRLEAGGIPQEAGVSSSSALTVASSIALASANNIPIRQDDLGWLAAEWEKYQTAGGAMDQVTSVMGQKGHAIVLDCRTREIKQVPLPAGYKFVAMHTKVKVQQVDSEYNERRTDVEIGTRWLKFLFEKEYPGTGNKIQKIRDITPENLGLSEKQIIEVFNMLPSEITVQQIRNSEYGQTDTKFINDIIGSRKTERPTYRIKEVCLYHRGEIKRVLAAQQALLDGDIAKFARAVNEGQVNNDDGGAENGLQNSCEELDAIIKIALANGAVCGRLSGKGWGGVAVATIPPNVDADGFMDKIIAKYEKITTDLYGAGKGIRLQKGITIFVCRTSNGAGIERYKPTAVPAAAPSPKPKMPGQVIETPKPVEAKPLMRILLVDDEMTARELYKSILQYCEDHIKWTIEVTTAESADDALTKINEARARREPFDIALTDVNMHRPVGCPDGVRPGVWLAQQIKALTKGHMPVFLISGLLDNNALPAGIRDGTIADGAYEKIKGILQNRAKFAKDMEAAVLKSKQATAGLDTLQQADQLALSAV